VPPRHPQHADGAVAGEQGEGKVAGGPVAGEQRLMQWGPLLEAARQEGGGRWGRVEAAWG